MGSVPTDTLPVALDRPLEPGSSGWSVADLLHPRFARAWDEGRLELHEGAIHRMPAAYFYGSLRLNGLVEQIRAHLGPERGAGGFAHEVDIALSDTRMVKADVAFLTGDDIRRQEEERSRRGLPEDQSPLFIAPTLVIESVSRGHEAHDRLTKRQWYARAGVPNYWLFNAPRRSLECLALDGADYRTDAAGEHDAEVRPTMFAGLTIRLAELWK